MMMVLYEIKKVLLKPSSWIALLLLIAMTAFSCFQAVSGSIGNGLYWTDEDGTVQSGYSAAEKLRTSQKEWSGTLDQDLLERALTELKRLNTTAKESSDDTATSDTLLYSQRQKLKVIRDLLNQSFKDDYQWEYSDYFIAETLESEELSSFYANRIDQLRNWLYDENSSAYARFSEQEKQYLLSCYETLDTPFQVGYTLGWDMSYEVSMTIATWGSVIMAFLVAQLFAGEFHWKAESVYFSTTNGKKRGNAAKLAAGFLLTAGIYWIIQLVANLFVLGCLGFDGASCPVQSNSNWWNCIYNVTFLQRTLLGAADGFLCWLFLSATVMLTSALFQSVSLAVCAPCLMMLLPRFFEDSSILSSVERIVRLLPYKMFTTFANESIALYTVLGKVVTPITIQRILYPALTIILAIICYQVYKRKQVR